MSDADHSFPDYRPPRKPDRPGRRTLISMLSWLVFLAVLVAVSMNLERSVVLLEPERPPSGAPTHTAGQTQTPAEPAPVVPPAELLRGYGSGNLNLAGREAERVGLAAARATLCGRESTAWLHTVRTSLADEVTERYLSLDENARLPAILMEYAVARFRRGEQLAEMDFAQRGREAACADLVGSSDYRAANGAAQRAAQRAAQIAADRAATAAQ